jgi:glycosyltransferase involved in cell wall biosynthesis
MRIVIANRSAHAIGGVEEYIHRIGDSMSAAGHDVAFCFETRLENQPSIRLPPGAQSWAASELNVDGALQNVSNWNPDVVYCNGFDSPSFERKFARIAPSAYSAHGYFGTCISGSKMHAFPRRASCERTFGPACLVQFFPRRCGGLNPATMMSHFLTERARLDSIRQYGAVIVHSRYMQAEYAKHQVKTRLVPLPVAKVTGRSAEMVEGATVRILFLGRMNPLKGGDLLIDAVERVARSDGRRIELVMAGDGPARKHWEAMAARAMKKTTRLHVDFKGWVGEEERDKVFGSTHLLAVPSCWPEPFGMVGLEAAAFGIPAVAFDVGGVRDWLEGGVNGSLADPASARSLSRAIEDCIEPAHHRRLAFGATDVFQKWAVRSSVDALVSVLEELRAK